MREGYSHGPSLESKPGRGVAGWGVVVRSIVPGPGRGHSKKPHEKAKAGNRNDYLVARIARDKPDILERMKAGEFPSVRKEAREAGIIKAVSLVAQVVRLWEKATPEERQPIHQHLAIDADERHGRR